MARRYDDHGQRERAQEVREEQTHHQASETAKWADKKKQVQGRQTAITLYDRREHGPIEQRENRDRRIEGGRFPRTQHVER